MRDAFSRLNSKALALAIVPTVMLPSAAFAQDATVATETQTTLISHVGTWGAVAVAVVAAVVGFGIAISMLKRGK